MPTSFNTPEGGPSAEVGVANGESADWLQEGIPAYPVILPSCHPVTRAAPCLLVSVSDIPRRVLRGFRELRRNSAWPIHCSVSIPRRVLRGFRGCLRSLLYDFVATRAGFNTPEGVEGFSSSSSRNPSRPRKSSSSVSIPRRVLRGFRVAEDKSRVVGPARFSFNTPEGVEGFSRPPACAQGPVRGP